MSRVTDGCERLAVSLTELARTYDELEEDFRIVAVPFHWGEAVVFETERYQWDPSHDFLNDLLGYVDETVVNVRLSARHGVIGFAVVPFTEDAASALAEQISRHAEWRREGQP